MVKRYRMNAKGERETGVDYGWLYTSQLYDDLDYCKYWGLDGEAELIKKELQKRKEDMETHGGRSGRERIFEELEHYLNLEIKQK